MFILEYVKFGIPFYDADINDVNGILDRLISIIDTEVEELKAYNWACQCTFGDRYENTKYSFSISCYREKVGDSPVNVVTRDGKVIQSQNISQYCVDVATAVKQMKYSFNTGVPWKGSIWTNGKIVILAETQIESLKVAPWGARKSIRFIAATQKERVAEMKLIPSETGDIKDTGYKLVPDRYKSSEINRIKVPKEGIVKAARIYNQMSKAGYLSKNQ
jgi:hypothetical protein